MSPAPPRVLSVNVALPEWVPDAVPTRKTAIAKRPVHGPVAVGLLGLAGDGVGDRRSHGGPDQAVYAFSREDLDAWGQRLGLEFPSGSFGENLTTSGIDVNQALVGEVWRVGGVVLEVSSVRIPCQIFAGRIGMFGVETKGWVRRFTEAARPGPYLRVLQEGAVEAGDRIAVQSRPGHGVTVSTMFRALTTEPSLIPELLRCERLPDKVLGKIAARQARGSASNESQSRASATAE